MSRRPVAPDVRIPSSRPMSATRILIRRGCGHHLSVPRSADVLLERHGDAAAVVVEKDAGADRSDARLSGEVLHLLVDQGAVGGRDVHMKSSAHPRENTCDPPRQPAHLLGEARNALLPRPAQGDADQRFIPMASVSIGNCAPVT